MVRDKLDTCLVILEKNSLLLYLTTLIWQLEKVTPYVCLEQVKGFNHSDGTLSSSYRIIPVWLLKLSSSGNDQEKEEK